MLKYWKGRHLVLKRQVRVNSVDCLCLWYLIGKRFKPFKLIYLSAFHIRIYSKNSKKNRRKGRLALTISTQRASNGLLTTTTPPPIIIKHDRDRSHVSKNLSMDVVYHAYTHTVVIPFFPDDFFSYSTDFSILFLSLTDSFMNDWWVKKTVAYRLEIRRN